MIGETSTSATSPRSRPSDQLDLLVAVVTVPAVTRDGRQLRVGDRISVRQALDEHVEHVVVNDPSSVVAYK